MRLTPTQLAEETHAALVAARPLEPFSARGVRPSLLRAYAATAVLRELRGARVVGRKIGFSNRSIWPLYAVDRPIWGDVTEASLMSPDAPIDLSVFHEPRIEPEIALGLQAAPHADMDDAALAACVAWSAPAFEVVQSPFPGWRFETADAVIAGALHGALVLGPRSNPDPRSLHEVKVTLSRNGEPVETGTGAAALDGPLSALRHLVELLEEDPENPPLAAGEVISTGTLTDAWPLAPGETWSARYEGPLEGEIEARFR